eukprot:1563736-Rhodomonas_salina.3
MVCGAGERGWRREAPQARGRGEEARGEAEEGGQGAQEGRAQGRASVPLQCLCCCGCGCVCGRGGCL